MPKRITVSVDRAAVERIVDAKGWSNAYFGGYVMHKTKGWLTDWKRGKNLPSPEEAARMCAVLNVMPEEFLSEQSDVEKVTELLEEEIQKGADELAGRLLFGQKKEPTPASGDGQIAPLDAHIMEMLRQLTPENKRKFAEKLEVLLEFQSPSPEARE